MVLADRCTYERVDVSHRSKQSNEYRLNAIGHVDLRGRCRGRCRGQKKAIALLCVKSCGIV